MGCITLLSDFGMQDASAAIAKGILMQHIPKIPVIDISHEISPYHMGQAAYVASSAYSSFPKGAIHLLLFDLFSETAPKLVVAFHNEHYFFAPDNGIIPLMLGCNPDKSWLITSFTEGARYGNWLHHCANAIAKMQERPIDQLDYAKTTLIDAPKIYLPKLVNEATLLCDVAHIDHYENVALNINKQMFDKFVAGRKFEIRFKQTEVITKLANNYSDVENGEKLCRINGNNTLEIGINRGNAASLFGLKLGSSNNNIKINILNDSPYSSNELQIR